MIERPQAVLFDLDGTLIDSAPDLVGACNEMRVARGLDPMPYEDLRPMVGSGARGMVGKGFSIAPGEEGFESLREEFLQRYQVRMTHATRVFADVPPLLATLVESGIAWGIVTNKATRFAEPLVAWLAFASTSKTLVCGDTTPHSKPHPAPLLEAARRMGIEPRHCVYVGDDKRDAEAGRAAGMATVVAGWGYIAAGTDLATWRADAIIQRAGDLPALWPSAA